MILAVVSCLSLAVGASAANTTTRKATDFKDYDAYFTIEGYKSMKDAIESDSHVGTWVGCILAKDDKFYYGSYDNEITGGQLQMLRHVLGGN